MMNPLEILSTRLGEVGSPSTAFLKSGSLGKGGSDFSSLLKSLLPATQGQSRSSDPFIGLDRKGNPLKVKEFRSFDSRSRSAIQKNTSSKSGREGLYGINDRGKEKFERSGFKSWKVDPMEVSARAKEMGEKLVSLHPNSPEEILEIMRNDPEAGEIFKNMDDETALKVSEALMKASETELPEEALSIVPPEEIDEAQLEDLLSKLRENPNDGEFWQRMDDETALKLLSALVRERIQKTGVDPIAEETSPEEIPSIKDVLSERRSKSDLIDDENNQDAQDADNVLDGSEEGNQGEEGASTMKGSAEDGSDTEVQTRLVPLARDSEGKKNLGTDEGSSAKGLKSESAKIIEQERQAIAKAMDGKGNPKDGGFGSNHSNLGQGAFGEVLGKIRGESRGNGLQDPVRATVFSQLIEKAHLLKGPEQQKVLTIQLKPEFLGRVNLELSSKDGMVTARIMTENSQVREKLEEMAPQIKIHLADQGIKLDNFTVDVSSKNPDERGNDSSRGKGYSGFTVSHRSVSSREFDGLMQRTGPVIYHNPYAAGVDITV